MRPDFTRQDGPSGAARRSSSGLELGQARALARQLGAPVVARLHLPVFPLDPWAWWGSDPRLGPASAAWAGPDGETVLLGIGALIDRTVALEEAAELCSRQLERWVDARPEVPAALGGFAFDPSRGPGWSGFGPGRLVVPRLMVWRQGADAGCALAVSVAPDSELAALEAEVAEVRAAVARIVEHGARESPAHGSPAPAYEPAERQAWLDLVERARAAVASAQLSKLVVARKRSLPAPEGLAWDPAATAAALRAEDPRSQVFAVRGEAGWWVGATPELLASVRGDRASTVALAGTRPRSSDPATDERHAEALLASTKERLEHAIVAEAIRARLSGMAVEIDAPSVPRVARFQRVMHLETPIRARLRRGSGILDVARALHPTPAVAGAPLEPAMRWLEREERLDRGWYAGPVGWIDAQGGGRLAVALRSALIDGAIAHAYAGAGIVEASVPEAEWDETEHKLSTITRALRAERA